MRKLFRIVITPLSYVTFADFWVAGFYRTQVYLGSDLWVASVSNKLTDLVEAYTSYTSYTSY